MSNQTKLSDTHLVGDTCACGRDAAVVASWQKRDNLSVAELKGMCQPCAQEAVLGQTPPRRVREHDRARIAREKADADRRRAAKVEMAKAQESMGDEWGRR